MVHEEGSIIIKTHQPCHQKAFSTGANQDNRIKLLAVPWLVYSLLPYSNRKDSIGTGAKADILLLLKFYPDVILEDLPISKEERQQLKELRSEALSEKLSGGD